MRIADRPPRNAPSGSIVTATRRVLAAAALAMCALTAGSAPMSLAMPWTDGNLVGRTIQNYVEQVRGAPGVVVGIVDRTGRRFVSRGLLDAAGDGEIGPATWFRMDGLGDLLVGALVADMIERGELAPTTTLRELLPEGTEFSGPLGSMTVEALATGVHALPDFAVHPLVAALLPAWADRYPAFTDLLDALARTDAASLGEPRLQRRSPVSAVVLGELLARRSGRPLRELLRERVLDRYGLGDAVDGEPGSGFVARGASFNGLPARGFGYAGYRPGAGLLANAEQLLDLAELALQTDSPVAASMVGRIELKTGSDGVSKVGLGWLHGKLRDQEIVWRSSVEAGYASYIGVLPAEHAAIVVLANGSGDIDALAQSILDPHRTRGVARQRSWLSLLLTALGLLLAPMLLVGLSVQRADRPHGRAPDRIAALQAVLVAALLLLVVGRVGAWLDVPYWLWWAEAILCAVLAGYVIVRAIEWPWNANHERWSSARRILSLGIVILLLALLF